MKQEAVVVSAAVALLVGATGARAQPRCESVYADCGSEETSQPQTDAETAYENAPSARAFNWKGTLVQSGLFLAAQHSFRIAQQDRREALGGPFWRDYVDSVRGLQGWDDGSQWYVNYLGHPLMGGISGFIQIQNDPRGIDLEWDPNDSAYWKSRLKALGWAAVYSTTFELAPWGEAGIGNDGLEPGTMGYVDLVVTPLGGFGWILLEDYLDASVLRKLEGNGVTGKVRVLRVVLNPGRSVANLLRFKRPSHRDTR
jgi:hypothetical protein